MAGEGGGKASQAENGLGGDCSPSSRTRAPKARDLRRQEGWTFLPEEPKAGQLLVAVGLSGEPILGENPTPPAL